ncbi:MAG: hypothetical protein U0793_21735 [Gemmataceae bacterium]
MSSWAIATLLTATTLGQADKPPVVRLRPPVIEESRAAPADRPPDMVLRWNRIALDAIRAERTPPPLASRNLALLHVAFYEAVNAIDRGHEPYMIDVRPAPGASMEAAAAGAGHRVLASLYPRRQAALDRALDGSLAGVPDLEARDNGLSLGRLRRRPLSPGRQGRGRHARKACPQARPGFWEPTLPDFRPALFPGWGEVTPFAIRPGSQPRPKGPPPLSSPVYAAAFREVKELGARDSKTRTPDQTEIARFWADDAGTATPPGHWNAIADTVSRARGVSMVENARLFALLNMSLADAGLLCWVIKFHHEFWRPVTAIRAPMRTTIRIRIRSEPGSRCSPRPHSPPIPPATAPSAAPAPPSSPAPSATPRRSRLPATPCPGCGVRSKPSRPPRPKRAAAESTAASTGNSTTPTGWRWGARSATTWSAATCVRR